MCKKIQLFLLKSGDSSNDHPNDNGPNAKLKSHYKVENSVFMLKYGMKMFLPHHMKFVLVEAWDDFTMSDDNIISDSFTEK